MQLMELCSQLHTPATSSLVALEGAGWTPELLCMLTPISNYTQPLA
jgi:hypothetical protein